MNRPHGVRPPRTETIGINIHPPDGTWIHAIIAFPYVDTVLHVYVYCQPYTYPHTLIHYAFTHG